MAPKSPPPENQKSASAADPADDLDKRRTAAAARPTVPKPGTTKAPASDKTPVIDDADEDDEEDGEEAGLDLDDDEDEDLVVFTAREAAGALATIYGFIAPLLAKYKKMLTFVA